MALHEIWRNVGYGAEKSGLNFGSGPEHTNNVREASITCGVACMRSAVDQRDRPEQGRRYA